LAINVYQQDRLLNLDSILWHVSPGLGKYDLPSFSIIDEQEYVFYTNNRNTASVENMKSSVRRKPTKPITATFTSCSQSTYPQSSFDSRSFF
jgi:hypothetical protein